MTGVNWVLIDQAAYSNWGAFSARNRSWRKVFAVSNEGCG